MNRISRKAQLLLVAGLAAAASASQATSLAATDFGSIQADTIGTVATAAAIGVAILGVSLGWDVGFSLVKKFTKRGAK